eukprot:1160966-Pelagomonas_calceolata.AAC.8
MVTASGGTPRGTVAEREPKAYFLEHTPGVLARASFKRSSIQQIILFCSHAPQSLEKQDGITLGPCQILPFARNICQVCNVFCRSLQAIP